MRDLQQDCACCWVARAWGVSAASLEGLLVRVGVLQAAQVLQRSLLFSCPACLLARQESSFAPSCISFRQALGRQALESGFALRVGLMGQSAAQVEHDAPGDPGAWCWQPQAHVTQHFVCRRLGCRSAYSLHGIYSVYESVSVS